MGFVDTKVVERR